MRQFLKGTSLFVASILALSQVNAARCEQTMKPNGCSGVTLCHAYPELDNSGIHMDVGFLLEQMRITETDVGYTFDPAFNTLPKTANLVKPNFKLSWGVTAELGYHFEYDDWFLNSKFDWLQSKGKKSTSNQFNTQTAATGVWLPLMQAGADITYFGSSKTHLNVNYFALDTELNRSAYFTDHISIEPHAGIKLAFIYYKQRSQFTGGPAGTFTLMRQQTSNFWGIGPSMGVNSKWHLIEGFSFFCDSSFALLFGNNRVKDHTTYNGNTPTDNTTGKEHMNNMSPAARALLGFSYEKTVNDDKQMLTFRAALDTNFYWNQYSHIEVLNVPGAVSTPASPNYGTFYSRENNSFSTVGLLVEFGWDF